MQIVNRILTSTQKAILVVLCYAYFPFRGKATTPVNGAEIKKVVILSLAQLGDTVSLTPLFHQVKKKYPNAKVSVPAIQALKIFLHITTILTSLFHLKRVVFGNFYHT